jgi:antitoxin component of RelBE/YafQ-DinJ toxin-antitoxin module
MKNLIRHILKEEINKSLSIITNLYDIEENGSSYRGENKFQTYVTFYPKDYDNEMTREAATSICNWEIDDDGELIFKFMNLPQPYLIPLMNYVGDTEDLEDYLEDIHVEEAEKFLKRIKHRRANPLNENIDKNKKFLIDYLGEELINSLQKITSAKQLPMVFLKSIGTSVIQQYIDVYGPLYYFVFEGEPFIYKDRVSPKGEEYEMFTNSKGESFFNGQITNRLGLDYTGLKFSDIIDMFINEKEDNSPLTENVDKNKKFLIDVMGMDFTDKIQQITSTYDVPMSFDEGVGSNLINRWLNHWGPMYLVNVNGKDYIYQNRGDFEMFIDEEGYDSVDDEIPEQLGIDVMGLKFSDIIDIFFNEEESLNEDVNKNKNFLSNVMGVDFTGNIQQVKSVYDVPYTFYRKGIFTMPDVSAYLNRFGPMYIIELYGRKFIYQDRSRYESFISEDGMVYQDTIPEQLGIDVMGLRFSDIIDIYFNEEGDI